jgi:hypothetical protein
MTKRINPEARALEGVLFRVYCLGRKQSGFENEEGTICLTNSRHKVTAACVVKAFHNFDEIPTLMREMLQGAEPGIAEVQELAGEPYAVRA